jgi:pimeloyl-ACP methyl ester carboxylesterase
VHDAGAIDARSAGELARGAMRGRSTLHARAAILAADLLPRLGDLAMPVRIVWGCADRITPARMAPIVARRIPDASLDLLDDVGHMPMWERPDAVICAICDAAQLARSTRTQR